MNWYKKSNKFGSGYCAEFALALHEKTGYPIAVILGHYRDEDTDEEYTEPSHCFVMIDSQNGIDCYGERSINSMIEESYFSSKPIKITIEQVTPEEAINTFSMEGAIPEALKEAREIVEK